MQVLPLSYKQSVALVKSGIWVLEDEILRYAQNDKGQSLVYVEGAKRSLLGEPTAILTRYL
jgi:hypothetical protein